MGPVVVRRTPLGACVPAVRRNVGGVAVAARLNQAHRATADVDTVVDETPAAALEALRGKYEPYRESAPVGPFLRLDPQRFVCWRAAD